MTSTKKTIIIAASAVLAGIIGLTALTAHPSATSPHTNESAPTTTPSATTDFRTQELERRAAQQKEEKERTANMEAVKEAAEAAPQIEPYTMVEEVFLDTVRSMTNEALAETSNEELLEVGYHVANMESTPAIAYVKRHLHLNEFKAGVVCGAAQAL